MRLDADFSKISTDFEPLAAGAYRVKIVEMEERQSSGGFPQINFKHEIVEGDQKGRFVFDSVTLQMKDKKTQAVVANTIGLGRIKAYAAAILGEEAANSGSIDTDAFKGSVIEVVVEIETYTKPPEKGGGEGKRNKITKVLKAA